MSEKSPAGAREPRELGSLGDVGCWGWWAGGERGEPGAWVGGGQLLGTRTPPHPSQNHRKEESREVPREVGRVLGAAGGVLGAGLGMGSRGGRRGCECGGGGAPGPVFWGVPGPTGVGVSHWVLPAREHPRSTSPMGIKCPGASRDLCAPH